MIIYVKEKEKQQIENIIKRIESGECQKCVFWDEAAKPFGKRGMCEECFQGEKISMGGNDTYDKYGNPYELTDNSKEKIYDTLEQLRNTVRVFYDYLLEASETAAKERGVKSIEHKICSSLLMKFNETFYFQDY